MEGIEQKDSNESESEDVGNSSKEIDDLAKTTDKKKKSTKQKRMEALEKKGNEASKSKNDPTVVADFSRDDESAEGSRREMMSQSNSVRSSNDGPVGNKRFDANEDGAEDLPRGDEEGGGFFWIDLSVKNLFFPHSETDSIENRFPQFAAISLDHNNNHLP